MYTLCAANIHYKSEKCKFLGQNLFISPPYLPAIHPFCHSNFPFYRCHLSFVIFVIFDIWLLVDDDLFVSDVARGNNVAVECSADSLMTDQTSPLFLGWSMERLNRGFISRLYALVPMLTQWVDGITRYLTVLPGLALLGYASFLALIKHRSFGVGYIGLK